MSGGRAASQPGRGASASRWDWRSWLENLASVWRRSLRFRTIVVTIGLTALAILVAGALMAVAIQSDLFLSRRDQVLADARRATAAAQATLDSAQMEGDALQAQRVLATVRPDIARLGSTDMIAGLRIASSSPAINPVQNFQSGGLEESMLSPQLREQVRSDAEGQWWQSVTLPGEDGGQVPGIIVGQQLIVPGVASFELYLAYDLSSADSTLLFVQRTMWIAGLALIVILGIVVWFVVRSVTRPIGEAADTSVRLASGELGVRLTVRGEDELATLGRSFNAMADSIEAQIKELAELSLVQQRFVSDVSHELRTPLTTIRLAADMLNDRRNGFDPTTSRAAELLHAQVQRFETLLTDLLEISRYDAGSVQLELEPTSLAHLAEDTIASMQQLADQRGTEVRLVAPGGYSPVDMDPRRVRRIVRNLLGNAIEHGEGRPIVVTVDSNPTAVAVGVRDFGLGMTAEDSERVFDRFWRADPSRKRTIGGTGLGLSIALGDARLHGGTLAVWTEVGRGTNFVLTLPRQADPTRMSSPVPLEPDAPSMESFGLTQPIDVMGEGR